MSDARSAGSSEAPKKAGRDEAGTVCDASGLGFFFMYVEDGERTFRRVHRDAVSEAGMLSHARVNSKRVRGDADDVDADPESRVAVTDAGDGAGADGRGGSFGAGTWRVLKTVSFPDTRKIPPPTRPAFFSSRTCFASLYDDAGSGFGVGPASTSAGFEIRRELMGFKRSFVGSAEASESTMVMGTRRRFGGAVAGEVDDASGGAGISAGTVRCICYFKQRKSKARETYCLSLPAQDELVYTREFCPDSVVLRLNFECPL